GPPRPLEKALRRRARRRAAGGRAPRGDNRRLCRRGASRRSPLPRARRAAGSPRAGYRPRHRRRIVTPLLLPGFRDLLQILIVAAGAYYVLRLLARTRAIQMLFGLLTLVGVYFVARLLGLDLIRYIMEMLFQYGAIAALIVFHPELRSALARLGQSRMLRVFSTMEQGEVVEELIEGIERPSRAKIGAIVAVQRGVGLEVYIAEHVTSHQASISAALLA